MHRIQIFARAQKLKMIFTLLVTLLSLQTFAKSQESGYLTSENFQRVRLSEFEVNFLHKGQGEPLILLHGGGEWSYTFRKNIDSLAQKFSVFAMDLPGHGYTVPSDGVQASGLGFPTIRRMLSEFMDSQGIRQASVLGHSWGGGFAIDFALSNPERVKSLVLLDSSGLDVPDHWEWEILKVKFIGRVAACAITPLSTKYSLKHAFYDRRQVTEEMVDEVYAPLRSDFNRRALYYLSRNLKWKPVENALGKIQKPTLIIWGEKDEFIPVKFAVELSHRIPGSSLFLVNNAGHNVHEERPEIVNQKIVGFLETLR